LTKLNCPGYGDCKALVNYTRTLLSIAGVDSYYTRVMAGRGEAEIDTGFVHNFSNHIILCVPVKKDTIWLECTSQTSPFNYLGSFSSDRYALVVSPEGGKMVRTQTFRPEDNLQICNAEVEVNFDGNCSACVTVSYRGLQYENVSELLRESDQERRKWLHNNLGLNDLKIESYKIEDTSDAIPEIKSELNLAINNYASITGDRIFIRANLLNVSDFLPERIRNRQFTVRHTELHPPYIDKDTIRYLIPEGYEIEALPRQLELNTRFGIYKSNTDVSGNIITYTRMISIPVKDFPASAYNDFRDFFLEIARSDKARIVLKKTKD